MNPKRQHGKCGRTTNKASVRARRKKAAWNDAYMLKLLAG